MIEDQNHEVKIFISIKENETDTVLCPFCHKNPFFFVFSTSKSPLFAIFYSMGTYRIDSHEETLNKAANTVFFCLNTYIYI